MVSRAPPARVTSCWTLSSASARSLAQRSWRADAALVQGDRALEGLSARLELGDDPLERREGVVERELVDRGIGAVEASIPSVGSVTGLLFVGVGAIQRAPDAGRNEHDTIPRTTRRRQQRSTRTTTRSSCGRGTIEGLRLTWQPLGRRRRSPGTRRGRRGCGGESRRSPPPGRERSRRRRPADDAVAALEGRLRAQHGERCRRLVQRGAARSQQRARRAAAARSRGGPRSRRSRRGEPGSRGSARSSRSPASWRDAASRAAGLQPVEDPPLRIELARAADDGARRPRRASAPRRERAPTRTPPDPASTSSAAAVGVAARTSAAKSVSVTSTSCPTPLTTGTGVRDDRAHDALVVERPEVLQRPATAREDRHGRAPRPPARSRESRRRASRSAAARGRSTPPSRRPGPGTATRTTRASGQRRAKTWRMSFHAAPDGRRDDATTLRPRRAAAASAPLRTDPRPPAAP